MGAEYTGGCKSQRGAFEARLRDDAPLVLDGATGTELERRGVPTRAAAVVRAGAARARRRSCSAIHADYAAAGAEVITANTFRTQRRTLARGGLGDRAAELTRRAVELARRGARERRRDAVFVLGSAPTLEDCYRPDLVPDARALAREHGEHARNLAAAGVDAILVETMNSVREAIAATRAARATGLAALVELRLLGRRAAALRRAARRRGARPRATPGADAVLVNCLPPSNVLACLAALARSGLPFGVYANLGEPNDETGFTRSEDCAPEAVRRARGALGRSAGARIVGGCCGTTPAHLRAVAQRAAEAVPRPRSDANCVTAARGAAARLPARRSELADGDARARADRAARIRGLRLARRTCRTAAGMRLAPVIRVSPIQGS